MLFYLFKEWLWQCEGFDVREGKWTTLPPLESLNPSSNETFKESLAAGGGGLICANVPGFLQWWKDDYSQPYHREFREFATVNPLATPSAHPHLARSWNSILQSDCCGEFCFRKKWSSLGSVWPRDFKVEGYQRHGAFTRFFARWVPNKCICEEIV